MKRKLSHNCCRAFTGIILLIGFLMATQSIAQLVTASMVKDIVPGATGSSVDHLTNVNGTLFFRANDGINGVELWKSDGTSEGTMLVKNINSSGSSTPTWFTNVNGVLFFTANDGVNGRELWKSDGTESGTVLVKNISPGAGDAFGIDPLFINVNGTLFFRANNGANGLELWKSDGTESGTILVKDIWTGSNGSAIDYLTELNGVLYFAASNGIDGSELWKSDGTELGTVLVKDINPGVNSSTPSFITNVNGTLYFYANDGESGSEPWKSDGTEGGTILLKDINSGSGSSTIGITPLFTDVDGAIFFRCNDGMHGVELWKTNGTTIGTVLVSDINPGSNNSWPSELINLNGTLFFSADNGSIGAELWKSDGTGEGTVLVKDIYTGVTGSGPSEFVLVDDIFIFKASDAAHGQELWWSNGTAAGTKMVADIWAGIGGSAIAQLINVDGTLFFRANNSTNGDELWKAEVFEEPLSIVSVTPSHQSEIEHTLYVEIEFNKPIEIHTPGNANVIRWKNYANDEYVVNMNQNDVEIIDGNKLRARFQFDPPSGVKIYPHFQANKIKDLDDNFLAEIDNKEFWHFTTNWQYLSRTFSPTNFSNMFPLNGDMKIVFEEEVKRSSTGSFTFRKYSGNEIVLSIPYDSDVLRFEDNEVYFDVNHLLEYNTQYYITMSGSAIRNLNDIPALQFNNNSTWVFKTEPDPELFAQAISFSPAHQSTDVPVNTNIAIQFSNPVTFSSGEIHLYNRTTETLIRAISNSSFTLDGNTVTVDLGDDLPYDSEIAVRITLNAFISEDYNVITISDNDTWYFTTVEPDYPKFSALSPINGADNVSANPVFEISFDRPMFAGIGANSNFIVIRRANATAFEYFYVTNEKVTGLGTNKLTITPSSTFAYGESYYIEIPANIIKDADDIHFQGITDNDTWAFTIESEPLGPPQITEIWPGNGDENVAWTGGFEIIFNQAVTYTGGNGKIRLKNYANNGTVVSFQATQITVNDDYVELYFPEDFFYNHNTKYFLEIDADAFKNANDEFFAGFADKDDHAFTASWSMPEVTHRNPAHNATNVDRNQVISITFDRPIELQDEEGVSDAVQFHIRLRQTPIGGGSFVDTNYFIGDGAISYSGNTLTITPEEPLDFATQVNVLIINNVVMGLEEDNGEFEHTGPLQGVNSTGFYLFTTKKEPQTINFELEDVDINELEGNIILEATSTSGLDVSFELLSGPANLVNDNELEITGTGTIEVKAFQEGNEQYAYTEVIRSFNVFDSSKEDQTITFAEISDKTFGDDAFELSASASSELPIIFTVTAGQSFVSLEGNTVTILGAGNVTIRASQEGDETYNAATPVSRSFIINKASQTINFTSIADVDLNDLAGNITLEATASSGLAVSYELVSGPANLVNGNELEITGAGTVTVKAIQAGNNNYEAAESEQSFTVFDSSKENQTITFAEISDRTFGDDAFDLDASASSALTVTFTVTVGQSLVSLDGTTVSILGAGNVTIRASQAGNDEYNPATAVSRSFTINKAAQVITINEIADKEIDADAFDVIASVDTALPLTYSVTGPATIEGVTVTLSGETGTVTITVTQAGNENYLAAEASTSFEVFTPVTQQAQSINFPAIADRFKEEGPLTLNATATSGLAVSYEIVSGPATIAGNVVSFTGLGTVSIRASQAGNEQFLAAAPVERSFEVNTVTGVEEVQRILNLQVYPNPVAHEMHIRFNESLPVQMKMYNLQGNEVISLTDESEQRVDVSHLSSGLYLLRVNTSQGMLVYKVIKQ